MNNSSEKPSAKNSDVTEPTVLDETDLEQVDGGVGLLLPAVQAARESYSSPPKKNTAVKSPLSFSSKD